MRKYKIPIIILITLSVIANYFSRIYRENHVLSFLSGLSICIPIIMFTIVYLTVQKNKKAVLKK
jgi:chromate transport protein ChrA